MKPDMGAQIIDKAKEMGASMAGIANVEILKKSPSHEIIKKLGMEIDGINPYKEICDFDEIKWPEEARSALVIAVSHPQDKPELDWWDGLKGTLGNSELIRINRELSAWIEKTFNIKTHKLPYFIEKGGIYLKDTAVLAGLGCIGKNNMLVTPELGPKVRLRALLLEEDLTPTGPIDFDPCNGCEEFCKGACPQNAFEKIVISSAETGLASLPGRSGCFSRSACLNRSSTASVDDDDSEIHENKMPNPVVDIENIDKTKNYFESCRLCEFACPVES